MDGKKAFFKKSLEDFIKFFKMVKNQLKSRKRSQMIIDDKRSVQSVYDDPFGTTINTKIDYGKFRTILFEALYKHQSDKPYRFDWFPILTKI